jgi:hypothetical protein
VRWRLIDLAQWVFDAFRVSISKQTLSRELRAMGFRKLSARPRYHAKDEEAAAALGSRRTTGLRQTDRDLVPRRGSGRDLVRDGRERLLIELRAFSRLAAIA